VLKGGSNPSGDLLFDPAFPYPLRRPNGLESRFGLTGLILIRVVEIGGADRPAVLAVDQINP